MSYMERPLVSRYDYAKPTAAQQVSAIERREKRAEERSLSEEKKAKEKAEAKAAAELAEKQASVRLDAIKKRIPRSERDAYVAAQESADKEGVPYMLMRDEPAPTDESGMVWATTSEPAQAGGIDTSDFDRAVSAFRQAGYNMDQAVAGAKESMKKQAGLMGSQAGERAELEESQSDSYDKEVRTMEALQAAHQQGMDRAEADIRAAEDELSSFKIDPNRAFKSTGSQVASALAIAAGAFAQGLSRGQIPNTALRIIEGAIERDIDAQRSEMQKRKDVLGNRNNIFAKMMNKYQNETIAKKMTISMGVIKAKMDLNALLTKHKGQAAQVNGQVLMDQLDAKLAENKVEIQKGIAGVYLNKAQMTSRVGGAAQKKSESVKLAMSVFAQIPSALMDFKKVSTIQGGVSAFMPFKMQQWFGGMTEAVTYENTRNFMAKGLTKAFDGGRPTEMDFKIFVQMFPAPDSDERLGEAQFRNIQSKLNIMIADAGRLEPGMIERAARAAGVKPGREASAAGAALSSKAEEENWGFIRRKGQ